MRSRYASVVAAENRGDHSRTTILFCTVSRSMYSCTFLVHDDIGRSWFAIVSPIVEVQKLVLAKEQSSSHATASVA
jgi:hypothetical protein